MAFWISIDFVVDSWVVCTCQYGALPLNGLTSLTVGLDPPFAVTTCSREVWFTDVAAGTVNTDPPLKSTLKSTPRKISASRLTTRMNPEIVYQSFCRLTKSKETSPRYSRPPMLPSRDITPPWCWSRCAMPSRQFQWWHCRRWHCHCQH